MLEHFDRDDPVEMFGAVEFIHIAREHPNVLQAARCRLCMDVLALAVGVGHGRNAAARVVRSDPKT
jgi:hypothetical protein